MWRVSVSGFGEYKENKPKHCFQQLQMLVVSSFLKINNVTMSFIGLFVHTFCNALYVGSLNANTKKWQSVLASAGSKNIHLWPQMFCVYVW